MYKYLSILCNKKKSEFYPQNSIDYLARLIQSNHIYSKREEVYATQICDDI